MDYFNLLFPYREPEQAPCPDRVNFESYLKRKSDLQLSISDVSRSAREVLEGYNVEVSHIPNVLSEYGLGDQEDQQRQYSLPLPLLCGPLKGTDKNVHFSNSHLRISISIYVSVWR